MRALPELRSQTGAKVMVLVSGFLPEMELMEVIRSAEVGLIDGAVCK